MAPSGLSLALFRGLLRRSKTFEGFPASLSNGTPFSRRLRDMLSAAGIHIPELPQDWRGVQTENATAAAEIRELVRFAFRANSDKQGPELDAAIDAGMAALRTMAEFLPEAERVLRKRDARHRDPRVRFHVGQVLSNIIHPYRCVVVGWDPECEEGEAWATHRSVDHDDVFYKVIVDERDAARHFKGQHMPSRTLYVAQSNLQETAAGSRIRNRHILDYFEFFSPNLGGRYVPKTRLQFLYPDEYPPASSGVSCREDSDVLSMALEEDEADEEDGAPEAGGAPQEPDEGRGQAIGGGGGKPHPPGGGDACAGQDEDGKPQQ